MAGHPRHRCPQVGPAASAAHLVASGSRFKMQSGQGSTPAQGSAAGTPALAKLPGHHLLRTFSGADNPSAAGLLPTAQPLDQRLRVFVALGYDLSARLMHSPVDGHSCPLPSNTKASSTKGGAGSALRLSSVLQMSDTRSSIPEFRADGYLPEGLHLASDAEVIFRFGAWSRRRRRLVLRLLRWLELARDVGAHRLLLDGSFVTAKEEPDDIDAVILLPRDFQRQVDQGMEAAIELEEMLLTRRPEELFAAEDQTDWDDWFEFFSRTREADARRKGLVEIAL